jgi:hypothetical protein
VSFDALSWAAKCKPGNLAAKMVLMALANYANEDGEAYPSISAIAEFGSMNRKTIISALDQLAADGFISDTGNRAGVTRQVKVYRLILEKVPKTEQSQKRKRSKNGTVPLFPAKSTVFTTKESQKRDTEPVREPVRNQEVAIATSARAKPARRKPSAKFAMPPDWEPMPFPAHIAELVAQWPPGRLRREIDDFRAFWIEDGRKRPGWDRTFHSRINDSHERILRDARNGRSISSISPPAGNRGTRPSPVLDMYIAACQAENSDDDPQGDLGAWSPVRTVGSG